MRSVRFDDEKMLSVVSESRGGDVLGQHRRQRVELSESLEYRIYIVDGRYTIRWIKGVWSRIYISTSDECQHKQDNRIWVVKRRWKGLF